MTNCIKKKETIYIVSKGGHEFWQRENISTHVIISPSMRISSLKPLYTMFTGDWASHWPRENEWWTSWNTQKVVSPCMWISQFNNLSTSHWS